MGKIIAFSNQKGGVGKTTTCVNISAYLASKGKKVLIVDMDPQGNATTGLGIVKSSLQKTIYDVLIDEELVTECVYKTVVDNLFILPSGIDLAGAEVELVYMEQRDRVLKKNLDQIKDKYDYITIDCPPSLGLLTINSLVAADSVLIPIQSEYYALEGLSQLMNTIKLVVKHLNSQLVVDGVIVTMYDNRSLISRQICLEISKYFGKKVFVNSVPRNVRISEAPSHGLPILLHDPKCAGAKAYLALTEEFLKKCGNKD